jgi:hypothetical protein
LISVNAARDLRLIFFVMMRLIRLDIAAAMLVTASSAQAGSEWLDSRHLEASEIRAHCERVSDIRLLARMQMISSGNERWRRLSRQELAIEATVMDVPPLDPGRCYVIARAGPADDGERRAFEVRDFVVGSARTSVLLVGHAYDLPKEVWSSP